MYVDVCNTIHEIVFYYPTVIKISQAGKGKNSMINPLACNIQYGWQPFTCLLMQVSFKFQSAAHHTGIQFEHQAF